MPPDPSSIHEPLDERLIAWRRGDGEGVIGERFEVDRPIGRGSFGTVLRCLDRQSGQLVALKVFRQGQQSAGYVRELGLLFDEHHPHIVRTLTFGYTAGAKYLVHEYVPGGTLRDWMNRLGRLHPSVALELAAQATRALGFAHARGVVHRDLKPENILMTRPGWPAQLKLCDFGLSTRVREGDELDDYLGSPGYMAPEQFARSYDHRVDYWSLGILLYEMLYGRRPFQGQALERLREGQRVELALPTRIEPALEELLCGLIAHDPDERLHELDRIEELIDRARPPHAPTDEARTRSQGAGEGVRLSSSYTAQLGQLPEQLGGTDGGELILGLGERFGRLDARGRFSLHEIPGPALSLARGAGAELAWLSDSGAHRWAAGDARGPRRLELEGLGPLSAPSRAQLWIESRARALLVADDDRATMYDLETGRARWRVETMCYGAPPVAQITPKGETWLVTDTPRSRLVRLSVSGAPQAELLVGGSDVVLAASAGELMCGCRGKRTVRRIDRRGFVCAERTLEEPLRALEGFGPHGVWALTDRLATLLDPDQLHPRATLELPARARLLCAGDSVFVITPQEAGVEIRRLALDPGDPR